MPRVFDNIDLNLLLALRETLDVSEHADFCVGYFNLRGWKQLDSAIEAWSGGEGNCCRLLVGMQRLPDDSLRKALSLTDSSTAIDQQTALRLKKKLAAEFREQLTVGVPTEADEAGLRRLARQLKSKKVIVKLYLRHPLHAKLYLLFRPDPVNPTTAFLGSSNLTMAGLSNQGELNIDILDHDACAKLTQWFEDRWNDRFCIDISEELIQIINESWARESLLPPYHIYLKMAYHLSQEARAGLAEFRIPSDFGNTLFEFQVAAVKIAAHHLNRRGGVLLGDVVGLGKTLMATALARIFEDDYSLETLIICPKNLVQMWEDYRDRYRLRARVLSVTRVINELPKLRRFRLVVIDESHNLRNREGRRYRAIREYLEKNESQVILLSATPYNKTYLDLSSQLRLFLPEDATLGVRPEEYLRAIGETEFIRKHQCGINTLAAFEKSEKPDDWRELMRLFLVRRTRTFIKENYTDCDSENGRSYLTFPDGSRSYFPDRTPKTLGFNIDDKDPDDQFAKLYDETVVGTINALTLPRYGLGNYIGSSPHHPPTTVEGTVLQDLSRAGKRLMGFCRTNLFKRLESSGEAFLLSLDRHILRNFVFIHALENGLPVPIGTQDSASLDTRVFDGDSDATSTLFQLDEDEDQNNGDEEAPAVLGDEEIYRYRAAEVYRIYETRDQKKFKWLRSGLFVKSLTADLLSDSHSLIEVLKLCGSWEADQDRKLATLLDLVSKTHPNEKVLVFTQFADTVRYLERELRDRDVIHLAGVTGDSPDPTALAWRFSPKSNEKAKTTSSEDELRVLITTDVLSEGQNLQDCAVVINYDLPWAIIRLIQRVGRIDRIGQQAEQILCYSFLPAEGVERIIRLRARVSRRLRENAEVVGTDETFFGDGEDQVIVDLYNEKAGILEGEGETEVDLASYAYQIWKNAIDDDPSIEKKIIGLPDVVYSTRRQPPRAKSDGALVFLQTADGNDALGWIDGEGKSVSQSQLAILQAAACLPDETALPRRQDHHTLVANAVDLMIKEERSFGGQLGRPSGARFRTYERLKGYAEQLKGTLFENPELHRAIDEIYRSPLRPSTVDTLNRQLRSGIDDEELVKLVLALRDEDRLCIGGDDRDDREAQIICSMGLQNVEGNN